MLKKLLCKNANFDETVKIIYRCDDDGNAKITHFLDFFCIPCIKIEQNAMKFLCIHTKRKKGVDKLMKIWYDSIVSREHT